MASDPKKRLRYFNGQFLQAQDFIDDQAYHLDRQRRHNRLLHTIGVADGLRVEATVGTTQVKVTSGTAIDGQGRQIILTEDQPVTNLSNFASKKVFVVISYQDPEPEADPATIGDKQNTRLLEQGLIQPVEVDANGQPVPVGGNTFPPETFIRLALLTLGVGGNVTVAPDLSIQARAGAKIGDTVFGKVTLSSLGVADQTKFPVLTSGAANRVDLQGNLMINGSIVSSASGSTTGTVAVGGRLVVQTNNIFTLTGAPGAALIWNNPRDVNNNSVAGYGLVARATTTINALPGPTTVVGAAVAGISDIANVNGVYATARTGTHALLVEGTAMINGRLVNSHTVDTFINASGQKLQTGDVVKLKGTPVVRFRGQQNRTPLAEVTLADKESDSLVIGIVDCEAIPEMNAPDSRVKPEDPTFIEDGGEVYLVTLGVFAHCKVDATTDPIQVGDLLTSSSKPGHAKKATNPKIGSIIGKALEPLSKGTGYIAVFVNIQ